MLLKFKGNNEPCITYRVINETPVVEFDEVLGKYCECVEIEMLGLVAKELLVEIEGNEANITATDIYIEAKTPVIT